MLEFKHLMLNMHDNRDHNGISVDDAREIESMLDDLSGWCLYEEEEEPRRMPPIERMEYFESSLFRTAAHLLGLNRTVESNILKTAFEIIRETRRKLEELG